MMKFSRGIAMSDTFTVVWVFTGLVSGIIACLFSKKEPGVRGFILSFFIMILMIPLGIISMVLVLSAIAFAILFRRKNEHR